MTDDELAILRACDRVIHRTPRPARPYVAVFLLLRHADVYAKRIREASDTIRSLFASASDLTAEVYDADATTEATDADSPARAPSPSPTRDP